MLNPHIEKGDKINLFGVDAEVLFKEPYSNYMWAVALKVTNGGNGIQTFMLNIPTDVNTLTGINAWTGKVEQ